MLAQEKEETPEERAERMRRLVSRMRRQFAVLAPSDSVKLPLSAFVGCTKSARVVALRSLHYPSLPEQEAARRQSESDEEFEAAQARRVKEAEALMAAERYAMMMVVPYGAKLTQACQ